MSIILKSGSSGDLADVTEDKALRIIGPNARDADGNPKFDGGYMTQVFEADAGLVTGEPTLRQGDISANYRQRVAVDSLLFNESFPPPGLNTNQWLTQAATMTAVANGWLTLNNGNSVTNGHYVRVQSYRTFPLLGSAPLQVDMEAVYAAADVQPNCQVEFGIGWSFGNLVAYDGAFFRYTSGVEFRAILSYNGAEVASPALPIPEPNVRHRYSICINDDNVEYWVDDVLYAAIPIPNGSPIAISAPNAPVFARMFNTAAVGAPVQLKLGRVTVSLGDVLSGRDWGATMAGMGGGLEKGQTGFPSSGGLGNFSNSNPPTSQPLSNTLASYTQLGGAFQFAAIAGSEVDNVLFAWLNPSGSQNANSKTLMVNKLRDRPHQHGRGAGGGRPNVAAMGARDRLDRTEPAHRRWRPDAIGEARRPGLSDDPGRLTHRLRARRPRRQLRDAAHGRAGHVLPGHRQGPLGTGDCRADHPWTGHGRRLVRVGRARRLPARP